MSIENKIEELTAAVNLLAHTIQKLVTVGAVQASGTAKSPEAAFKAAEAQAEVSEKPKAEKAKAEKPKAEKPKADKTDKELLDEVLAEAETDDGLPAGERDEEYYKKHVRPHIIALGDKDRAAAIGILESFGVKKAQEVPTAKWGELVDAIKAALNPAAPTVDEDDLG
jgi:hypothetical protein